MMKGRKCAISLPIAGVVGPHCITFIGWSWDPGGKHSAGRLTSGAGWSGPAPRAPAAWKPAPGGLTAASLPPTAACDDGHLFRRALSLGLPSAQREPCAPDRAYFLQPTSRPREPISEPVTWSFPFPFPCEQEVTPGPRGRGLETPSILKMWQELT